MTAHTPAGVIDGELAGLVVLFVAAVAYLALVELVARRRARRHRTLTLPDGSALSGRMTDEQADEILRQWLRQQRLGMPVLWVPEDVDVAPPAPRGDPNDPRRCDYTDEAEWCYVHRARWSLVRHRCELGEALQP